MLFVALNWPAIKNGSVSGRIVKDNAYYCELFCVSGRRHLPQQRVTISWSDCVFWPSVGRRRMARKRDNQGTLSFLFSERQMVEEVMCHTAVLSWKRFLSEAGIESSCHCVPNPRPFRTWMFRYIGVSYWTKWFRARMFGRFVSKV